MMCILIFFIIIFLVMQLTGPDDLFKFWVKVSPTEADGLVQEP